MKQLPLWCQMNPLIDLPVRCNKTPPSANNVAERVAAELPIDAGFNKATITSIDNCKISLAIANHKLVQ